MASSLAFEILYKEYYARVFGLCRRLLNSASLAEDATQESFMRAYRRFNTYSSDQPFWRWIASIASNHCVDLLRKRHRTKQLFGDEAAEVELLEADEKPGLAKLIEEEQNQALATAMDSLADKYRIPLVLAYFNDASYEDIAVNLSISRNHVGVLLLRGKRQLRKRLSALGQEDCP